VSAADDLRRVDKKLYFAAVILACNKAACKKLCPVKIRAGISK